MTPPTTTPATAATADGLQLRLRHWPLARSAAPVVLIVHGLGEHSGRYEALARALNDGGFGVSAYDQRGHGESPGARGVIPAPDSLCADLARVIDALNLTGPRAPILLGHSLGGLVTARFVAESLAERPAAWRRDVAALALSSPALDAGLGLMQSLLLAQMSWWAPSLALGNGLRPERLSRDAAVIRAYVQDPLVHDRICARLARFIVDGGEQVRALAPRWRVPTLLQWSGADRCVNPAGSAAFAAAAPPDVVRHHVWPTLLHEIYNEPEREAVIERTLDFLRQL
jgi:alpha-beta hydrolase superfamily lysophospholipase